MKLKQMQKWQLKKLLISFFGIVIVGVTFLSITSSQLYNDKMAEDDYWVENLTIPENLRTDVEKFSENATIVTTGTYIENLKEINLKACNFRLTFLLWFKWEGDPNLDMKNNFTIYKGYMNKMEVIKESNENGLNYQLVRCDATITKNYWAIRFPLESHQLRVYIEPGYMINEVRLIPGEQSSLNKGLSIAGYYVDKYATGEYAIRYENAHGDPSVPGDGRLIKSEHVTALQINRDGFGLYIKCFVALVGTITWVLITLFICTYHYVDPLSMIPAALFGTVANIMVGANLLPDALQAGLLEYVNIWGIFMILIVAISIININQIRKKYEDKEFSKLYGRVMFYTLLALVVIGNLVLPISAYIFS